MNMIPYSLVIGSIMYAMLCTRPDVSYALSVTSRYQSDPGMGHWVVVKNILKYLRRTKDVFLIYGDGILLLMGIVMPVSNLIEMTPNLSQVTCKMPLLAIAIALELGYMLFFLK